MSFRFLSLIACALVLVLQSPAGARPDSGQAAPPADRAEEKARPALLGFDPVRLSAGEEVKGLEELAVEHGGYRYLFATEADRKAFLGDPARYEIQFKGACAYMVHFGEGPGSGDPDRFHVHKGRIYIFGTENCRDTFKESPDKYAAGSAGEKP